MIQSNWWAKTTSTICAGKLCEGEVFKGILFRSFSLGPVLIHIQYIFVFFSLFILLVSVGLASAQPHFAYITVYSFGVAHFYSIYYSLLPAHNRSISLSHTHSRTFSHAKFTLTTIREWRTLHIFHWVWCGLIWMRTFSHMHIISLPSPFFTMDSFNGRENMQNKALLDCL